MIGNRLDSRVLEITNGQATPGHSSQRKTSSIRKKGKTSLSPVHEPNNPASSSTSRPRQSKASLSPESDDKLVNEFGQMNLSSTSTNKARRRRQSKESKHSKSSSSKSLKNTAAHDASSCVNPAVDPNHSQTKPVSTRRRRSVSQDTNSPTSQANETNDANQTSSVSTATTGNPEHMVKGQSLLHLEVQPPSRAGAQHSDFVFGPRDERRSSVRQRVGSSYLINHHKYDCAKQCRLK